MPNPKIWLSPPHMGVSEQKFVKEAFDTNWVAPLGQNVNEFEYAISKFLSSEIVNQVSSLRILAGERWEQIP